MLLDVDRKLYCAVGLGRSVAKVWNISTLIYYASQKAAGRTLPKQFENVEDDPHQMGGDFIIDRYGYMGLLHCSQTPTDRPSVDELIKTLQSLKKRPHYDTDTSSDSQSRKKTCVASSTSSNS